MKLENFIPIKSYQYEFLGKDGSTCLEKEAVAKSVTNLDTEVTRYYIKGHGRIFYDVQSKEASYHKKHPWKMVNVSKQAYNEYVQFLKTKRRRFLTSSSRHIGV